MKNRSLGTIVVAGMIALALVATAYGATKLGSKPRQPAALAVATTGQLPQDVNTNGIPDWQESLNATTRDAGADDSYHAPASLPPTEALAREIFADYAAAKQGGTLDMSKATAAIADSIAHSADTASVPKTYTLTGLSIHADVPISAYAGAVTEALKDAGQVTEYELTTFSRAMKGSRSDIARLQAAAAVYAAIAEKLATLQVPASVATDHLAAMNSLAALSAATKDLAHWGGDPLVALSLVNNFTLAEAVFSDDIATLYARLRTLEKKS